MTINLELYRVFIVVAREGSFTRAARQLGLTQSAVSQAVRQLEGLLETQLFVRGAKGARLTETGRVLMGHVGGFLAQADAAQRYFEQLRGLGAGSLRIGASDTLCRYILVEHMKAFHQQYPAITLHVTNRTSAETAQLLRAGSVDIGFVNLPLEDLDEFDVHEVMRVHDCLVCSARYAKGLRMPLALAELAAHPLLMLERQSASRRYLDAWLAREGFPLVPQIELGSLDLLLDFAQAGLGIAAVVREFAGDRLGGGLVEAALEEIPPPRSIGMLLRKGVPPSAATLRFMELVLGGRNDEHGGQTR